MVQGRGRYESFIYFFGILKHLQNINQFVSSIREASFDLFVASLKQLCPLLFALDHIHYSRWIPVFIHDLKLLKVSDHAFYYSFGEVYFVARKTDTAFSKIACDHVHEQNKKSLNRELVSQVCLTVMNLCFFVRWRMSYQRFTFIFLKSKEKITRI